jgi:hypothetical protein
VGPGATRGNEAIHQALAFMDYFASLAVTNRSQNG